jgi:hypothetical protein
VGGTQRARLGSPRCPRRRGQLPADHGPRPVGGRQRAAAAA